MDHRRRARGRSSASVRSPHVRSIRRFAPCPEADDRMAQERRMAKDPIGDQQILLELYRRMLRLFYLEETVRRFVRQNKCSFHASSRGHEKLQIACSMVLKSGKDWFFPYY